MENFNEIPEEFKGKPIRPIAKKTRLYVDNEYFENGYAVLFKHTKCTAVYCVLAKYAHHTTQTCYPAAETIMRLTGITNRNQIFTALKKLQEYNLIAKTSIKGNRANHYILIDNKDWKPANSITVDTAKPVTKPEPVSNPVSAQYQKSPAMGISSDTGNHITNSSKENSSNTDTKIIAENNTTLKTAKPPTEQIQQIMALFYRKINPPLNFKNQTFRSAAESLISLMGFEETMAIAEYAISIQGLPFAPTITTPYELKEKLTKLGLYKKRAETPQPGRTRKIWK